MNGMNSVGERRVAVVIEDDIDIRHLLETVLEQAGFQTIATGNGLDGIEAVRSYNPLVTTLDVNMPGIDGMETARRLRQFSNTYIVMLTALDEEIDMLRGLDAGADDYVTKPFRPRELRARIEAMLRRPRRITEEAVDTTTEGPAVPRPAESGSDTSSDADAVLAPSATGASDTATGAVATATAATATAVLVADDQEGWIAHRGLRLNSEARLAQVEGSEIDLTRSEFDLIAALMESKRRVRTKADLALLLRGESYVTSHYVSETDKRAIEVHMANLRRKIGDNTAAPRFIETVRGVGYRLTAPEDA